jgi:hypothetical protein
MGTGNRTRGIYHGLSEISGRVAVGNYGEREERGLSNETGNNIVDQTGAIAETGCFRMDALLCGAPATVQQFEAPPTVEGRLYGWG